MRDAVRCTINEAFHCFSVLGPPFLIRNIAGHLGHGISRSLFLVILPRKVGWVLQVIFFAQLPRPEPSETSTHFQHEDRWVQIPAMGIPTLRFKSGPSSVKLMGIYHELFYPRGFKSRPGHHIWSQISSSSPKNNLNLLMSL